MKKIFLKPMEVKSVYLLIVPILFMSCSVNQKIAYRTDNLLIFSNSIPITVSIKELSDKRRSYSDNLLLFNNGKEIRYERKRVCINSEKHYNKETVTWQISRQMAEHFDKVKLFRRTTFANENQTNYYITGSLSYFYGMQDFSTAVAVGSQFGLIGALATSGTKTPADIVIEIKDLALYDKKGRLVQNFGTYRQEYFEELYVDAACWCIYGNMNQKLSDFIDGLAEKISSEYIPVNK